ncbi:MAG: mechanosensitive ion channel [Candidatus Cloacimonadota bacterium]|nr:mechanosensitive ion channel [Candidatus Cloacimonadota bacterium]
MEKLLQKIGVWLTELWNIVWDNLKDVNFLFQALIIIGILSLSFFIGRILRNFIAKKDKTASIFIRFLQSITFPLVAYILLFITENILMALQIPSQLFNIFLSLMAVLIVIRVVTFFIKNVIIKKIVLFFAWVAAIFHSIGKLESLISFLDSLAINISGSHISVWLLIKTFFMVLFLSWLAIRISQFIEYRLFHSKNLKSSLQVLLNKVSKVLLFVIVFFIIISNLGIKLTAFAFITGAIGIGVGFGLQKVVSNLISGLILLLDESIKPGDVVEVEDTFGWVNKMGARYTSVISRDGKEFLIPNENMITNQVVNWSHSDNFVRFKAEVGVSYNSDIHQVMDILFKVTQKLPRILQDPTPKVLLTEFGDSSVNFVLNCWISDPQNGIANIKSAILIKIWDEFQKNNIEIPFPQQDLHIRSVSEKVKFPTS